MRNKILLVVILVALVALGGWYFGQNDSNNPSDGTATAPDTDVMEVVLDFYNPWLESLQGTTTDPWQDELWQNPVLADNVRAMIQTPPDTPGASVDPVLCQTTVPERIGTKVIYEQATSAEVAVLARTGAERSVEQAAVTLEAVDGQWQITAINCGSGESAPEREFTFEQEGYLLKDSLPDTMDRQYWHLVYEQRGQPGHTVPLFFDTGSVCIDLDGNEIPCEPNTLQEASRVFVQGQMLEAGLEVDRLHDMPSN